MANTLFRKPNAISDTLINTRCLSMFYHLRQACIIGMRYILIEHITHSIQHHLLPSSGQHRSNADCPKDKREDYQNCSVLYCLRHLCTVIRTHVWAVPKVDYYFSFRFSLDLDRLFCHFVPVLFAFVVLYLVSSLLSQEIGYMKNVFKMTYFVSSEL